MSGNKVQRPEADEVNGQDSCPCQLIARRGRQRLFDGIGRLHVKPFFRFSR